jgi:DNA polymerase III epsilon subunit-like protein
MLGPGAAVVLDTETSDLGGAVCEVAVVDAATGTVLVDTLVNPETPISLGAYWVHGIRDADLVDAPLWPQVLATLLEVTRDRVVLAYNSDYDRGVIAADSARHGLDPGHLAEAARWGCVMNRRSDWARRRRWMPLEGGHRALPDAQAALEMLQTIARSAGPRPHRARRRAGNSAGQERQANKPMTRPKPAAVMAWSGACHR